MNPTDPLDPLDPEGIFRLAAQERQIAHARDCLRWLTGVGVQVLSMHCYHHLEAPQILVASGENLVRALPADDIAWIGQHRRTDGVIDRYLAHRLGCAIHWQQEHLIGQPLGRPFPRTPPHPEAA